MTQLHFTRSKNDSEMFYALVASADRRRDSRQPSGEPATACRIIAGKELDKYDVLVSDISKKGIGLRSTVPLEKGCEYRLQILGEAPRMIRVVRSRKRGDGAFDVGAINL